MTDKKISIQVLQEVLNYLAKQPYIEVAEFIQVLSQLPDVHTEVDVNKLSKSDKSDKKL